MSRKVLIPLLAAAFLAVPAFSAEAGVKDVDHASNADKLKQTKRPGGTKPADAASTNNRHMKTGRAFGALGGEQARSAAKPTAGTAGQSKK